MNDREDIDGLAAEYVLGTLEASERTAAAARRQREGDLDAAARAKSMARLLIDKHR